MSDDGTATPRRNRDVILASVVQRCLDDLDVSAAAVVVATGTGSWMPASASDATIRELDQYAFTVGEGPCFDALRDHAPVIVADLSSRAALGRWPAWTRKARELGFRSVAAFPVHAGAISAGVLTLMSDRSGHLDSDQVTGALRLADVAFLGLLDLMAGLEDSDIDEDDLSVLLRADVHSAAGMVMAQADVTIDQALVRLRAHAFASGRPLADVAADVLDRQLRFESDERTTS